MKYVEQYTDSGTSSEHWHVIWSDNGIARLVMQKAQTYAWVILATLKIKAIMRTINKQFKNEVWYTHMNYHLFVT